MKIAFFVVLLLLAVGCTTPPPVDTGPSPVWAGVRSWTVAAECSAGGVALVVNHGDMGAVQQVDDVSVVWSDTATLYVVRRSGPAVALPLRYWGLADFDCGGE